MRLAVLVLAAGAGSRFGGGKLLARLEDRPILQHVLDVLAGLDPAMTVVVLGADAEAIERAIDWRGELRVRNPDPSRGMASSLQLAAATVEAGDAAVAVEAVLVVLGDQPRLRASVIRSLVAAGDASSRPVVVPRYAGGGGGNPVLVRREAWPLIAEARGDRGLGPILAQHPDLVMEVPVDGTNPDVDRPEDLAALIDR
jgi:CTP:molybdopterin cytidylyltransferase MocA